MDITLVAVVVGGLLGWFVKDTLKHPSPPKFSKEEVKLIKHLRGMLALKKWESKEVARRFLKENLKEFIADIFKENELPLVARDDDYITRAMRSVRLQSPAK